MKKLRDEFNEFREQVEELRESFKERFHSMDEKIQSLKREYEQKNGNISTAVQIQSIRNKLETVEERIRRLEALKQCTYSEVI